MVAKALSSKRWSFHYAPGTVAVTILGTPGDCTALSGMIAAAVRAGEELTVGGGEHDGPTVGRFA